MTGLTLFVLALVVYWIQYGEGVGLRANPASQDRVLVLRIEPPSSVSPLRASPTFARGGI